MTHEHPRHRGAPSSEQLASDADVMGCVVEKIARLRPDHERAQRLNLVYQRRGAPFAAYLTLDDVDLSGPDIEAGFEAAYVGHFADRAMLVQSTIDTFGWRRDLERLVATHIELRTFVDFNRDAVVGFVRDHYDVVETDTGFYLFEAWQRRHAD